MSFLVEKILHFARMTSNIMLEVLERGMHMYKAMEIAEYVINYSNEIGNPVSNLKLQKLLYYIQATTLVERGIKCFEEPIVAWEFGPVVVLVYQVFREYGREDIPKQVSSGKVKFDSTKMKIVLVEYSQIDNLCKKIIEKIVEAYEYIKNPFELVEKTHCEIPWQRTNINEEIDCELIREYYSKNIEKLYS